jgi:hypothetical protein
MGQKQREASTWGKVKCVVQDLCLIQCLRKIFRQRLSSLKRFGIWKIFWQDPALRKIGSSRCEFLESASYGERFSCP